MEARFFHSGKDGRRCCEKPGCICAVSLQRSLSIYIVAYFCMFSIVCAGACVHVCVCACVCVCVFITHIEGLQVDTVTEGP